MHYPKGAREQLIERFKAEDIRICIDPAVDIESNRGVCHCFSGSAEIARCYTNLGLMLGIGGALLIDSPKKQALEQAVISTPIENVLLETDGPYVKPACPDIRKKQMTKARNTSLIIPAAARRIEGLKHLPVEEVLHATSENAIRLFGLDCERSGTIQQ